MRRLDYFRTTAFRHALLIAAFFTASSLIVFSFVYWQTVSYASREVDRQVRQTASAIASVPPFYTERRLKRWLGEDTRVERYGILLDPSGRKLAGNIERVPDGAVADGQPHTLHTDGIDKERPDHDDEIVRGVALKTADGRLLLVAVDTDEWEHFRDVVFRALALGLIPTAALGCIGGALFGRSVLGRMAEMDLSINRIMNGNLSERLPHAMGRRVDEFDRLAVRVNRMLDEIQRLLQEVQVVGDSVAHDLRTPLTRVLTRLETAGREARTEEELRVVLDEATEGLKQTLGIITAVLRIGEIEHGRRRAAFRPFDAATLLREAHEVMEPLAEEKGVSLGLDIRAEQLTIVGDRELLLEALLNLIENAIKFTPSGGACRTILIRSDLQAIFRVEDSGPGIPLAERDAVLRRFYRAGGHHQSEGTGLGLALVAAVARLHDFNLVVGGSDTGCVMELHAPADDGEPVSAPRSGRMRAEA